MATRILVTGGTGRLGRAAVSALLSHGFAVRSASRHPQAVPARSGVEAVALDWADTTSVRQALDGMDGALLIAPPRDWEAPEKVADFIKMAAQRPDLHVVFISVLAAELSAVSPLRRIENMLRASASRWTILRPNFFMDNFIEGGVSRSIREKGTIVLAAGAHKISFISAADIAEVVACVFRDGLVSREFNLTGPAALDHHEVAAIISAVSGRPVRYMDVPENTLRLNVLDAGMPEPVISYLEMLYRAVRADQMAGLTNDVCTITGHAPLSFTDFARRQNWE